MKFQYDSLVLAKAQIWFLSSYRTVIERALSARVFGAAAGATVCSPKDQWTK
jgi:hypothetical protein